MLFQTENEIYLALAVSYDSKGFNIPYSSPSATASKILVSKIDPNPPTRYPSDYVYHNKE